MNTLTQSIWLVVFVIVSMAAHSATPPPGDNCLTPKEADLAKRINNYRQANHRNVLPISKSLTITARAHVWDSVTHTPWGGSCNLHSWSNNAAPGFSWTGMCYTSDHSQASHMWNKPDQITNGVYSSHGYEISAWTSATMSSEQAFNLWRTSSGHDAVMRNTGGWSNITFNAMGIGIDDGYAHVWFGRSSDPQGTLSACDGSGSNPGSGDNGTDPDSPMYIFSSNFE